MISAEENSTLSRSAAAFARSHIAPVTGLHLENRFPMEIWRAMGAEGLLGLTISKNYGGMGGTAPDLAAAICQLVKEGHCFGLALSFLIHHIVAHYVIEAWADESQKERYLPHLAQGTMTACLAVSEPQRGAHPKHLTSVAVHNRDGYHLTGEKTYLTNGPIADLFVVIAVSESASTRKRFSAFILPRNLPGLEILPPLKLPFFKPAPHGGIRFNDLKIPPDALLGPQNVAYDNIVLPVRQIEDILMTAAVTGLLEKQADLLAEALKPKDGSTVTEEIQLMSGKLKTMVDAAGVISRTAAGMLDSSAAQSERHSLPLFFRTLTSDIQRLTGRMHGHARQGNNSKLMGVLLKELHTWMKLGRAAAKSQLLNAGGAVFEGAGKK